MIKKTTKQSKSQVVLSIIGGLLFMFAAAFEALFVIVDVVLLFQGESPSVWLLVGLAVAILVGWGLVALSKEKLGNVISNMLNNGI